MPAFKVFGPFEMPTTKKKASKSIEKDNIEEFKKNNADLLSNRGCYIFAFRAAKGQKPIYVGKTNKSFAVEIFGDHKLKKYMSALADQKSGTAVFYFVVPQASKGPPNKVAIDQVETYLIQCGLVANKNLLNDRKTKQESWSISGIVRSTGKPSNAACSMKKCLKIE